MPEAESAKKDTPKSKVETAESADARANQDFMDASEVIAQVATVAVVGIGCAATIEAALLPGFVIGVAAMLVPKLYPKMGNVSLGKLGTFSNGLRVAELALGVVNLKRRPLRASRPRMRSRY
jgi:hypothetical protein